MDDEKLQRVQKEIVGPVDSWVKSLYSPFSRNQASFISGNFLQEANVKRALATFKHLPQSGRRAVVRTGIACAHGMGGYPFALSASAEARPCGNHWANELEDRSCPGEEGV